MECSTGSAAMVTKSMTSADYDAAYMSIARLYKGLSSKCNATYCPQSDWSGCVLRAAGHDLMDYKDSSGGADGCMDLHDPDNKGLHECLYQGEFGVSVMQAYQEHCVKISLADFLVIAAESVMLLARQHVLQANTSRAPLDFKSGFRYGRRTAKTCSWVAGRLPDPERSCTAVRETFVESMGLSWPQAAALMGVHTLGRASVQNSGYSGFWSDAENSRRFNNDYYVSILDKGWRPESVNKNPKKNQWRRSDRGADEGQLGKEMMLNTDLCLAFTQDRRGEVELSAGLALSPSGRECCAWRFASNMETVPPKTNYHVPGAVKCGNPNVPTGPGDFLEQKVDCCGDINRLRDCGDTFELRGPAYEAVKAFSLSEEEWLRSFLVAWRIATSNGFSNLKPLE